MGLGLTVTVVLDWLGVWEGRGEVEGDGDGVEVAVGVGVGVVEVVGDGFGVGARVEVETGGKGVSKGGLIGMGAALTAAPATDGKLSGVPAAWLEDIPTTIRPRTPRETMIIITKKNIRRFSLSEKIILSRDKRLGFGSTGRGVNGLRLSIQTILT